MPLYNAEDTVEKAIESILNQTFKNVTLVIVDDASTDNSLELAKQYLKDPRVMIYQNSINMGAYYSRNYGLFAGRDLDWTHFTTHDADDVSFSGRYKAIIKLMDKDVRINGVQDMFDRINTETETVVSSKLTMAHAVFVRSVFENIGYFDLVRFGGDWEHWRRLRAFNAFDEYGKTSSLDRVNGESYIHDTNLTVLIPENSKRRASYTEKSNKKILRMSGTELLKYDFVPEKGMTKRIQ